MAIQYQADTTTQERAMLRAATEGVQVQRRGDMWQATSVSRPGILHLIIDGRCDCEAAHAGRYCKHLAAIELATEQQSHVCNHCGAPGAVPDRTHGGYFCQDRTACWRRWDRQNGLELASEDRHVEWALDDYRAMREAAIDG